MGAPSAAPPNQEPRQSVEDRCRATIRRWEAGELPFKDAQKRIGSLAQEAEIRHDRLGQAFVEYSLGYMQGYRTNLSAAAQHFEAARDIFIEIGDEKRVASCNLNLGEVYRQRGDFTHARELFHLAYENAERLDEVTTQTIALANEGQMLLSMSQIENARNVLQQALDLSEYWPEEKQDELPGMLCEVYHGLAVIFLNDGDVQAAWEKAKLALRTARTINQPLAVGQASRTMGEVLTTLEAPPEDVGGEFSVDPDEHFKASVAAFEELDSEGEVARTLHAHARSLAKRGKRVPAARKLQQAMLVFARLGMVDDAAKAAEAQAEIF